MRRLKIDLIEVYKITHGFSSGDLNNIFTYHHERRTRGHSSKLYPAFGRLNIRKFFFSLRVVNRWNSLPDYVVNANKVPSFKLHLNNYFVNM